MFSDDSAIVGCISRDREDEYRSVVDRFVEWCGTEPPAAQCHKDKGVGCGFQKTEDPSELSCHQGYRSGHCGQIQRHLLRCSVLGQHWLKTANTNRHNKLIRRAGSVLGVELESVAEVSERRMLRKLLSIMDK
ncbi:hypothetical protein L3Q82_018556, partial [Scortum barcoo]